MSKKKDTEAVRVSLPQRVVGKIPSLTCKFCKVNLVYDQETKVYIHFQHKGCVWGGVGLTHQQWMIINSASLVAKIKNLLSIKD